MNDWAAWRAKADGSKETLTSLSRAGDFDSDSDSDSESTLDSHSGSHLKTLQMSTRDTWQRLPNAYGNSDGTACINQMQTHKISHTHMQSLWGLKICHSIVSWWILHEHLLVSSWIAKQRQRHRHRHILTHFDMLKQSP